MRIADRAGLHGCSQFSLCSTLRSTPFRIQQGPDGLCTSEISSNHGVLAVSRLLFSDEANSYRFKWRCLIQLLDQFKQSAYRARLDPKFSTLPGPLVGNPVRRRTLVLPVASSDVYESY